MAPQQPFQIYRRQTAARAEKPMRPSPRRKGGGKLLAVQSIACAAVLLTVLLLRLTGADTYGEWQSRFSAEMRRDFFSAVWGRWFEEEETPSSSNSTASSVGSTTTAVESTTLLPAHSITSATSTGTTSTVPAMGGEDAVTQGTAAPAGASLAQLHLAVDAVAPLTEAVLTSPYGYRENPITGEHSFHKGVDLSAVAGTPIYSLYDGVVSAAGTSSSYGNYVRVRHSGGVEVMYAHCSYVLVEKGQAVKAGERIAKVGNTGNSTGSHLHIELRFNGIVYDPAGVLPMDLYA